MTTIKKIIVFRRCSLLFGGTMIMARKNYLRVMGFKARGFMIAEASFSKGRFRVILIP
jgi:hypothetical protein